MVNKAGKPKPEKMDKRPKTKSKMKENSMNSIIAISGGILGGVSKPLAGVIADVTVTGAIEVAIYAALSAFVGLLIKEAYNRIRLKIRPGAKKQEPKAKSQKPKA